MILKLLRWKKRVAVNKEPCRQFRENMDWEFRRRSKERSLENVWWLIVDNVDRSGEKRWVRNKNKGIFD